MRVEAVIKFLRDDAQAFIVSSFDLHAKSTALFNGDYVEEVSE